MKKIFALLLAALMLFVFASAAILPREEIPIDTGAEGMAILGILKGTDIGYELEREVTRAEALTFIWRTTGVAFSDIAMADFPFEDVKGHWAADVIEKFYIAGYIDGTSATTFQPQRTVTGKEFLKILLTVMGYSEVTIENALEIGKAADVINNNFTKSVVEGNYSLLRSDVTRLCRSALTAKCADGQILYKKLIDNGLYTQNDFEGILFCATPAKSYFADDLNSGMPKNSNYMFSPLSIKMALVLAANGAVGETYKEISEVAEIYDIAQYNETAKSLIESYLEAKAVKLSIANSIWLNKDESTKNFARTYKDTVYSYYGAEAKEVDRKNAVKTINNWVADKTNEKIPEIINSADFWAALVNAVYFSGNWNNEFEEELTSKDNFYNFNGTVSKAEFMQNTANFMYFADDKTTVIELPYESTTHTLNDDGSVADFHRDNVNISMYIMMTDYENRVAELENIIGLGRMKGQRIHLYVPKFKIETSIELNDILKNAGIIKAFDAFEAEFEKMFDKKDEFNMYIDKILHKTYINVDEKGTEAAAVTAIMMAGAASAPTEPIEVKFDKPFTFVIRDNTNEEILFMGEYMIAE